MSCTWDIRGNWHADVTDPFIYSVDLNITGMSDEHFWTDLKIPYFYVDGAAAADYWEGGNLRRKKNFEPIATSSWWSLTYADFHNKDGGLSDWMLTMQFNKGENDYDVATFYADSAICGCVYGLSWGKHESGEKTPLYRVS